MTIIKELKSINVLGGLLREMTDVIRAPRKLLHEAVSIGVPYWDPPEDRPPTPPDPEAVTRAQEVISMAAADERRLFTRVLDIQRKIKSGEPREEPRATPPIPPPPGPRPRET